MLGYGIGGEGKTWKKKRKVFRKRRKTRRGKGKVNRKIRKIRKKKKIGKRRKIRKGDQHEDSRGRIEGRKGREGGGRD